MLREKLNWFETRPLFGKRIVVTRTRQQAGVLSSSLRALGADVFEMPIIRIEPPTNLRDFGQLVQDSHTYDWIVFTSPNGVTAFFEMFFRLFDDARAIVPYLARLGISHIYASPFFRAAPGSTHGYDVCDHNELNPEIGSRADFEAWTRSEAFRMAHRQAGTTGPLYLGPPEFEGFESVQTLVQQAAG